MRVRFRLVSLGVVVLAGGVASADVVKLRNGDVLEGKARDLGETVRVVNDDGITELPWTSVEVIDLKGTAAEVFAARKSAVGSGDVKGLFSLALWSERQGLVDEARDLHKRVLELDPDHAASREALHQGRTEEGWKGGAELLRARGFVPYDGRWMLQAEADAARRLADSKRKVTDEEKRAAGLLESLGDANPRVRAFAAEALASVEPALQRRLWNVGIRHRNAAVRAAAAKGLGVKGDETVVRSLLRTAILDGDASVRQAAALSLKAVDLPDIAWPINRAMYSENARTRTYAAEAAGIMGSRRSVETLIRRVHWTAGPTSRVNIQVYNQVSYIRDFDVEIAQLAQIGDPIIGQLSEGVILDAQVYGAEGWETAVERRAYTTALANITGKDFGTDLAAWRKWWEDEGKTGYGTATAMAEGDAAPDLSSQIR